MSDQNSHGHSVRQERFVHPNATRRTHDQAVTAKLMLICRAAADEDIKPSSVVVLAVIVQHMYGRIVESWPSQATIGARTGLARRTVQYAVRELESHGYLLVTRVQKTTNVYRLPETLFRDLDTARSGRSQMRPVRTLVREGSAERCGTNAHAGAPEYGRRESESIELEEDGSRIAQILEAKNG